MRAWRVHELGEPADVLRLEEIDAPTPAEGQVRVRVLAAAANFPDVLMCRGHYQVRPELPFTAGFELCGFPSLTKSMTWDERELAARLSPSAIYSF